MSQPKFFTFDPANRELDEAFTAVLADLSRRDALVADALDSLHCLSPVGIENAQADPRAIQENVMLSDAVIIAIVGARVER